MSLTGVFSITTDTYEKVLDFNIKNGMNTMVFGKAGIGKSEIAIQRALKLGYKVVYWNLSTQQPPDLIGLPIAHLENGQYVVKYASPKHMPISEMTPEPVVVIVDEIDKADSDMQNPMLECFQFHTINGVPLNVKAFVATGNLPDENAFSKAVSHALTNRCGVYALEVDFDSWQKWAKENDINPLIVGFLSKNVSEFSKDQVANDPTAYCRSSPRSWVAAAKTLSAANLKEDVGFLSTLVAGFVGVDSSTKFRVWLEHLRDIEPFINGLLKKGEFPEPDREWTIDKVMVFGFYASNAISLLHQSYKSKDKGSKEAAELSGRIKEQVKNLFTWLSTVPNEVKFPVFKSGFSEELMRTHGLFRVPEFMKVVNELTPVINSKKSGE